jgi:hypothetical protein
MSSSSTQYTIHRSRGPSLRTRQPDRGVLPRHAAPRSAGRGASRCCHRPHEGAAYEGAGRGREDDCAAVGGIGRSAARTAMFYKPEYRSW